MPFFSLAFCYPGKQGLRLNGYTLKTLTMTELHPILRERYSPMIFEDKPLPAADIESLFEAARWAASSFNEQPWRFVIFNRFENAEAYKHGQQLLIEYNQQWSGNAPLLVFTFGKKTFTQGGQPNHHHFHDVGLAIGNLSAQATHLGICLHQMAGFQHDKANKHLGVPEEFAPVSAIAIGYPGPVETIQDQGIKDRATGERQRMPLSEILHHDGW